MKLSARTRAIAIVGVATGAALGVYVKLYQWPKVALEESIRSQQVKNASFEGELAKRARVKSELAKFAVRTLSAQTDMAVARFRSALDEIAAGCGLGGIEVNTSAPETQVNPAGNKVTSSIRKELQKQADFAVLSGEVAGQGTLEQVLTTMALVRAQPWVHRVESFSIKPEDKERQKFSLRIGVATVLMADAPKDLPEPRIIPLDPEAEAQWAAIVKKNMFREPPPLQVAMAEARQPQPEPGPPPVPWGEWKLTGVIETRRRVEALMVNSRTKESAVLTVGSGVLGATFVAGSRDAAVFEIGGQRYDVVIGQTLEQRSPVAR